MVFFNTLDGNQRYKCSISEIGNRLVISAMPLLNVKFPLDNYHLTINDFAQHDYIAEFLFLQNTSERSLNESRELMNRMVEKNKKLEAAKKDKRIGRGYVVRLLQEEADIMELPADEPISVWQVLGKIPRIFL